MANVTFRVGVDMTMLLGYDESDSILSASNTEIRVGTSGVYYDAFRGTGFIFSPITGSVTGGTVTSFVAFEGEGVGELVSITGINVPAVAVYGHLISGDVESLNELVFAGSDSFVGSAGNDFVKSYAGNDTLNGGSGNDTFEGASGNDRMIGGDGNDVYFVRDVGDVISEDSTTGGIDTVYSYLQNHTLSSNVEIGRILGSGTAHLTGNTLDNLIYAATGNNVINGGAGIDTVSYAYASGAITVSLANTVAQTTGSSGSDTLINIESLMGSGMSDKLTGNSGANSLTGYSGNDTLDGGLGNDTMIGGDGNDVFYIRDAGDVVSEVSTTGGVDLVCSYLSNYTLGAFLENARILTTAASNLNGNLYSNVLYAGSGNNVINGSEGRDTVSYTFATAAVTVNLGSTDGQVTGGSGTDTLWSIENLSGSSYADKLTGSGVSNNLTGGAGADTLDGGAGNDQMIGGDGNDIYCVRDIGDALSESGSAGSGIDTVYSLLPSYTLGLNVENGRVLTSMTAGITGNSLNNLLYAGAGNNVINGSTGVDAVSFVYAASAVTVNLSSPGTQVVGGSGADTLIGIENVIGSKFNDSITGNSSANTLTGGEGNDLLTGGLGQDIFRMSSPISGSNIDRIIDFRAVDDTIQLENSVFIKLTTTGVLDAGNFVASADGVARDSNDFIVYETDTGKLFYDADGSGSGASVWIASLSGAGTAISSADIFVT